MKKYKKLSKRVKKLENEISNLKVKGISQYEINEIKNRPRNSGMK